jgi:hypothetical protein
MTSLSETTEEDQMFSGNAQTMTQEPPDAGAVIAAADPQPPDSAAWEYDSATAAGSAAEYPEAGDAAEAEIPQAGWTPDTAPESIPRSPDGSDDASPVVDDTSPVVDDTSPAVDDASPVMDDTSPAVHWPEIQATFVDDPRACLEQAAQVIGDSVEAFTVSIQERQHALLSPWQRDDTGTEELRVALQHYRMFWNRLEDITREA